MLAERLLHGEVSARIVPGPALAHGALRARPASVEPRRVLDTARLANVADVPRAAGKLARSSPISSASRSPAALHGAALRHPSARERAGAPRARDRRQQHHQRAGDDGGGGRRRRGPRARHDDGRAVRAVRLRDAAGGARRGVDPATHRWPRAWCGCVLRLLYRVEVDGPRARACRACRTR